MTNRQWMFACIGFAGMVVVSKCSGAAAETWKQAVTPKTCIAKYYCDGPLKDHKPNPDIAPDLFVLVVEWKAQSCERDSPSIELEDRKPDDWATCSQSSEMSTTGREKGKPWGRVGFHE